MSTDPIFAIFEREIARIDAMSKERALDADELMRLNILVRSVKDYTKREAEKPENPLSEITTEDLLILINKEKNRDTTRGPESSRSRPNRKASRK
jgi:hypothetical protein